MKGIEYIIYTSRAGHTKEYAELLSGEIGIPAVPLSESSELRGASVIYMGWIRAGKVMGYRKASRRFDIKATCIVGTYGPGMDSEPLMKKNGIPLDSPLFPLQGGFELYKTRGLDHFMMKFITRAVSKGLSQKEDRTEEETAVLVMFTDGADCVCKDNLSEIIAWCRN